MTSVAVIFDMDGTLLDTLCDIQNVVNRILSRHGYRERSRETFRKSVGWGVERLLESILPEKAGNRTTIACLAEQVRDLYESIEEPSTMPFPAIPDLLEMLQSAGVPMAILTNKPQKAASLTAHQYFPCIKFQSVLGSLPGKAAKPDPEAALSIADKFGVDPSRIVLVGDSEVDIQTGINAGMQTIGVLWGFRDRQVLEKAGAGLIVSSAGEIADLLLTGCRRVYHDHNRRQP